VGALKVDKDNFEGQFFGALVGALKVDKDNFEGQFFGALNGRKRGIIY